MLFIDNLRWTMIILDISMHAADTYSPLGNWYFEDRKPLSAAALLAFAAWQMYLQSFFMGLLFFIAGYFVPASFDRKGPSQFVRERSFRLGLPVLFYMFVLGPITEYFCAHSWNSTEPTSFANEWVKHIRNGEFLHENGPLWFCLALLIFSLVYAALRALRPGIYGRREDRQPPNAGKLVGFALVLAASTFLVRLVLPSGSSFLNMHLGDFPQYILMFSAGVVAARGRWLLKLSHLSGTRWLMIVLPAGFAGWLIILRAGGALTGKGAAFAGGWHWQGASMNLWESFIVGGAGGVGSIATQLLKAETSALVISTASRPESREWCHEMGADLVIDHSKDIQEQLAAEHIEQVDMVFSTAKTADNLPWIAKLLRPFGHLSVIDMSPSLNANALMLKSASLHTEIVFSKILNGYDLESQGRTLEAVASLVAEGRIRPIATTRLREPTPETMRVAHDLLESGRTIGKVVVATD